MAKSKRLRNWIIIGVAVAAVVFFGYQWWKAKQSEVPKGIAWGNGRLEAKLVDISAKEPLRVKEVLADEGDLVRPGQIVAQLDAITLNAQLEEAKASVASAKEQMAVARAAIVKQKSEIELARIEKDRAEKLLAENAASQREFDVRRMMLETATAALGEDEARLDAAKQNIKVAEANVATIQTRIDDATLRSPVLGRVLYRLAEPGEVLGPGGKALTLVNLGDVYMEIFLPSEQAAAIKVGADARITVDYEPGRAAIGYVSFVSPEAQFTPKQVETRSEREKLMFRVKIQVPQALVVHYIEHIKTGVRGVGYVKVKDSTAWPLWLQTGLVEINEPDTSKVASPADSGAAAPADSGAAATP